MTAIETASPLDSLRRRVRGAVIELGGAGWDAATQAFNLAFTQEPALVAIPADEMDVVAIVGYAREHGLQVAPQRTGHLCGAARSDGQRDPGQDRAAARRRDRCRAPHRPRRLWVEVG